MVSLILAEYAPHSECRIVVLAKRALAEAERKRIFVGRVGGRGPQILGHRQVRARGRLLGISEGGNQWQTIEKME